MQRAAKHQPQVDDRHVGALGKQLVAVLVDTVHNLKQAQRPEQSHHGRGVEARLLLARPGHHAGLEVVLAGVVAGQAVARARDQVEELGRRVDEVEDLRQQEQHEGLAEVALDADDHEDHAREVAVRVADENVRRVLVVGEEGEADAKKGQEEEQAEEVAVDGGVWVGGDEVQTVVGDEEKGDDNGLHHLDAIDACEDVDGIGAENGKGSHVDIVEPA